MLGMPHGSSARELSVDNWESEAACAKEVAHALGIGVESLLLPGAAAGKADAEASEEEADSEEGEAARPAAGRNIRWNVATQAMQSFAAPTVLVIGCGGLAAKAASRALSLLSRLVGAVAQAHVASHVTYQRKGQVSVVLRGWSDDTIEADWSDEDSDEFCISPLH